MAEELEYPEYPRDACINCGFLAEWGAIFGTTASHWETAGSRARTIGWFGELSSGMFGTRDLVPPRCWVGAASLRTEVETLQPDATKRGNDDFLAVIRRDRNCSRAVPWKPWLELKDHWDELVMTTFEEQRRAWQTDLEEQRKKWEVVLETNRELYESKLEGDRKSFELKLGDDAREERRAERRENRWWLLVQVLLGAAALAAAAVFTGGGEANYYGEPPPPTAVPSE